MEGNDGTATDANVATAEVTTPEVTRDPAADSAGLRWGRVAAAIGVGTAAAIGVGLALSPPEEPEAAAAEPVADEQPPPMPEMDPATALAVGETLQRQGEVQRAFEMYDRVPDDAGKYALAARLTQFSALIASGRLLEAEKYLDRAAAIEPDNERVLSGRVSLLSLSGRRWESLPYLREAIRRDLPQKMTSLIYLTNIHQMPAPDEEYLRRFTEGGDPYGLLCAGRIAAGVDLEERAMDLLLQSRRMMPSLVETSVQIADRLLETGKLDILAAWQSNMPEGGEAHPLLWAVRGKFAQENGQPEAALRCYHEALRLDPNHEQACYQIGQLYFALGKPEKAKPFVERSGRLASMTQETALLFDGVGTQESLTKCAETSLALGRIAEAAAWCDVLESVRPEEEKLPALRAAVAEYGPEPPWLAEGADLSRAMETASLPLPDFGAVASEGGGPAEAVASSAGGATLRFQEEAARLGVDFVYRNADDPDAEGRRMYEYTGGGVGAVDYDGDLWPDLYFTQGCDFPLDADQTEHLDRVYRNRRGEGFADVTQQTFVRDGRFGQGVSAGDYDNDGFADLLVGNLNGKRLLRNLGDGTFEDVTESLDISHDFWTTSVMLADLNGDGHPDVYDATFLQGDNVFTVTCRSEDGKQRSCAPKGFEAAPDFVYYGDGRGGFAAAEGEGWEAVDGDGLGVVAGDFEGGEGLEVFVANDGRANFYFRTPEGGPREEAAIFSGLGFDEKGAAEACMGIAAEDFNRDGLLDLYVTNFYQESNTLYMNQGGGTFLDKTRTAGVHQPSWLVLGFGCQAVDADLDGWSDVVVANGHVDNFEHEDIPYRMRPQLYRNLGDARFAEAEAKSLGDFFETPQLGRGLSRLDWNRDGREDFVVSNLEDPAAVVTNKSEGVGGWIAVRLIGRSGSRDAVGATVSVEAGPLKYARQQTAGDGYQACNERKLVFGLGDAEGPVTLRVSWPGGEQQAFGPLPAGREYILIEGGAARPAER